MASHAPSHPIAATCPPAEGVKLQPVKVSCRGLVLLLAKGLEPLQAVRIVEALLEGVDKASLQRPK